MKYSVRYRPLPRRPGSSIMAATATDSGMPRRTTPVYRSVFAIAEPRSGLDRTSW